MNAAEVSPPGYAIQAENDHPTVASYHHVFH